MDNEPYHDAVLPGAAAPRGHASLRAAGAVAVFMIMLGVGFALTRHGGAPAAVNIGGPFTLTSSNGATVTEKSWPGDYLLIYFGYTYCPDVCPTTLNTVSAALQKLGSAADRVQPVFITIDPGRDSPRVLKNYTAAFSPRLIGLTGTAEQIRKVAGEYRVYYAKVRTGPGPDDYAMDHSSIIYLMSPGGKFLGTIEGEQPVDDVAAQIAKHIT